MDIKEVAKWLRGEQAVYEEAREYNRKHENRQSMLRANAQAEEMSAMAEACERFTWSPIETAPRDGSIVLCYSKKRWTADVSPMKWVDEWKCAASGHRLGIDEQPTHWMPLPAAPQP